MQPTLSTRKPVDRLTVRDLEAFPIWEFATDEEDVPGMDETWVKPLPATEVPPGAFSLSVASVFRLRCGLIYPGLMCCNTYAGSEVTAVALLTERDRVVFSEGTPPRLLDESFAELGLQPAEVFPVEYSTRVPLAGSGLLAQGVFSLPGLGS
jgi:hypothetical protein